MSFFKDLFSSLSSNKNSENESQDSEISMDIAKRIIPQIVENAYKNAGLNNMTYDELKVNMKNDIFDRKLIRAHGDEKIYADMLKKDIVYYYNLMDDLSDHIASIITNRRLLSVDEWMEVFSKIQEDNLIHDLNDVKNTDILQSYSNTVNLIPRLEKDYTWMYINSSLLLGSISVIYEKPHFGIDLFSDCPGPIVDEMNNCCEVWTGDFFKKRSPVYKVSEVVPEIKEEIETTFKQKDVDIPEQSIQKIESITESEPADSDENTKTEYTQDVTTIEDEDTKSTEDDFKIIESVISDSTIDDQSNGTINLDSIISYIQNSEVNTNSSVEIFDDTQPISSKTTLDVAPSNNDSIVKLFEETESKTSQSIDIATDSTDTAVDFEEDEPNTTEYTIKILEEINPLDSIDDVFEEVDEKPVEVPKAMPSVLGVFAKVTISRVVEQSFTYTDFGASTYQDFQITMRENIFEKKLTRVNGDKNLYADNLKKNILYYYNLIEDLQSHLESIIKTEKLIAPDEWLDIFSQLQVSNRILDMNNAKNNDILDSYQNLSNRKLISSLERDYTWMYVNSNLWLGCIYAIYESPEFTTTLFGENPECVVDGFINCCEELTTKWG